MRNYILGALLNSQYRHLAAKLELVQLERGEVIYQADRRIEYVYFPETAVVAMLDTVEEGGTVEVGIIGYEGMVGINVFLGCMTTPDKAVVQIAGSAMRMTSDALRKELRFGSPLQRLLLHYTQVLLAAISQSVGCSQHHSVRQRLAHLLLVMCHYTDSEEFLMTQESMAMLLGARRSGISIAAADFQATRLITYARGRIRILDKKALAKRSCKCYQFIRQQLDSLHRVVPQLLSETARASQPEIPRGQNQRASVRPARIVSARIDLGA